MLKLTNKTERWFPVPQDESGEAQVKIKHLKPGEVADIEATTNDFTAKQKGEEDFQTEIKFRLNERTKKLVLKSVTGLKGFVDEKGLTMECTERNVLRIMQEYGWFGEFVAECRDTLADEVAIAQEGAEKN